MGHVWRLFRPALELLLSCLIVAAAGLASAFAVEFKLLVGMRALVGFGVAGIAVPFDLLMEFLPDRERGRMLSVYQYFWSLGSIFATVAAWLFLPRLDIDLGWRFCVGAVSRYGSLSWPCHVCPRAPNGC